MTTGRYDADALDRFAEDVRRESFCVLRGQLDRDVLQAWAEAFGPLLEANVKTAADDPNRGPQRFYVTLPFAGVFADARAVFDPDVLAVCERLVGADMVMCQLATDTPLRGSEYQDVHRDSPGLFPDWDVQTPPYQLAVNFPLVDVTAENGPTEIARGTHVLSKAEGLARIERGEAPLEPQTLELGDVVIRDVRHLHRGTPNRSGVPRPMVVVGFSRAWLRRPEVSVRVPRSTWDGLSEAQRRLLRFEAVVPDADAVAPDERYRAFAY
jgi:ectoine hydroxylase-related dioxygenase (phytanoyl-CoA dioxygenase family)